MNLLPELLAQINTDYTTSNRFVTHLYVCDTELQASRTRDKFVHSLPKTMITHETMFNVELSSGTRVLFLCVDRLSCRLHGTTLTSIFWDVEILWADISEELKTILIPALARGGKVHAK